MKKIFFLTNHLTYSDGVAISLRNLANELAKHDIDVTAYSVFSFDKEFAKTFDSRVHVGTIYGRYFHGLAKLVRPFAKSIFRHKIAKHLVGLDTFVAYQGGLPTTFGTFIDPKKYPSLKRIAVLHGENFAQLDEHATYEKIITIGESGGEEFKKRFSHPGRVIHIRNIYDWNNVLTLSEKPLPTNVAEFLKEAYSFVWVSRMSPEKGTDVLLAAAKELKTRNLPFRLLLVGGGAEQDRYLAYINENDLSKDVLMVGSQNNPYPYIKACSAFVCPSRTEGMCTSAVEALILDKPIISTPVNGAHEIIDEPKVGVVVAKIEEPSLLADAMESFIKNPNAAYDFKGAKEKFRSENTTELYLKELF
jgi:glycosyltransferase involved in cell wall biosynthesis